MNIMRYLLLILLLLSCRHYEKNVPREILIEEIRSVEQEFANMVSSQGIHKAFVHFADSSAVLKRNKKLIKGIEAINEAYNGMNETGLTWEPEFIDISSSGDMAYTYGQFIYSYADSLGNAKQDSGIFHTVWKKQADGSWKYVWD